MTVQAQAPAPTPLSEASAVSLDEIFSRDADHFASPAGKADIEIVVKELRRQRAVFAEAEAAGGKSPRVAKGKSTAQKETMSLKDLGLTDD